MADAMINGVAIGTPGVTAIGFGPESNFGGKDKKVGDFLGGFKDVAKWSGVLPLTMQILGKLLDKNYDPIGANRSVAEPSLTHDLGRSFGGGDDTGPNASVNGSTPGHGQF